MSKYNKSDKKQWLTLGLDATNLRQGGGRTHLIELLNAFEPEEFLFSNIIIWGSRETLGQIPNRPWLIKVNTLAHEKGLLSRIFWQKFSLSQLARKKGCDILFVPGGSFSGDFRPVVSMSRNLLPFEWRELRRYGISFLALKWLALFFVQKRTLRNADGVIFLTKYAREIVTNKTGRLASEVTIPHGINPRFFIQPRPQLPIEWYGRDNPFRILYVSTVDEYKHQWNVLEAVAELRKLTGWHLTLNFVGPAAPKAMARLRSSIEKYDPQMDWATYHGQIEFNTLHTIYEKSDLGVFASSCENMPNTLLEMMAAGLPIASSNYGPMPELLGDSDCYFNPELPDEIGVTVRKMIADPKLREVMASNSFKRAKKFSWKSCARKTYGFLEDVCLNAKQQT